MKHSSLLTGFLLLVVAHALAQPRESALCPAPAQFGVEPPATLSTSLMPEPARLAHFNEAWKTIGDNHLFALVPAYGSGDWDAYRSEYLPRVRAVRSDREFYETVGEMVRRFDRADTAYWPAWLFDVSAPADDGYAGIGALQDRGSVEREGEYLRIKRVYPGSPAEHAGLAPRDRILAVDGSPCPAASSIRGVEGTTVTLTVQSPGQPPRDVQLTRRLVSPPEPEPVIVRLEVEPTLAYLRIPSFESVMAERVQAGLERLLTDGQPLSGLMLDLRDSSGVASMEVQDSILGHFLSGAIYRYFSRHEADIIVGAHASPLYPRLSTLPLALLVDGRTTRTAETMAMALRTEGTGWLIGAPTPGRTYGFQNFDLADGSRIRIPTHGVKLFDQATVEGVGLTPDIVIDEDWTEYREAEDPYLLAAHEYLRGKSDVASQVPGSEPRAQTPEPLQAPLTCEMTAQEIDGDPGTTVAGSCPENCDDRTVWGTDIYTDDSRICTAAIHAGVIDSTGGPVVIIIEAGQEAYQGSERNGVSTFAYGSWGRSFSLATPERDKDGEQAERDSSPPTVEAPRQDQQATRPPAERAAGPKVSTCSPALVGHVVLENSELGFCLSHDSRWEVVGDGVASVTIRIPSEGAPESMALNINVSDEAPDDIDLDAVIDSLIEDFFPQQDQFQEVQVLERSEATVAGRPGKFLAFSGKLVAGDQLLDVVGNLYVLAGGNRRLYSLTFIMDTTRVPEEAYRSSVDVMRDSFRLTVSQQQ